MASGTPRCGRLSQATRGRAGALVRAIPLPIAGHAALPSHALNTHVFIHLFIHQGGSAPSRARWLLPRQDIAAAHTELLERGGRARGLQTAGFGADQQLRDSSQSLASGASPSAAFGSAFVPPRSSAAGLLVVNLN